MPDWSWTQVGQTFSDELTTNRPCLLGEIDIFAARIPERAVGVFGDRAGEECALGRQQHRFILVGTGGASRRRGR